MKIRNLLAMTAGVLLWGTSPAIADTYNIGYCPADVSDTENVSAQGTGENLTVEPLIRISAATMPALKGASITAVRCYLRTDYEQKSKYSRISVYVGHPSDPDAVKLHKKTNLYQGWNEIELDEPVVIGDQDVYVGYQVFENSGEQRLPIMSYSKACPAGAYILKLGTNAHKEMTANGTPFIQAVVEADPEAMAVPAVACAIYDVPMRVAPDADFSAGLYVKNLSSTPINSCTFTAGGREVELTAAIPAFGFAEIPVTPHTAATEGSDVAFPYGITAVNGTPLAAAAMSELSLFVTRDNFIRIPLLEEYTSMECHNCPYMSYWIDKTLKEYTKPVAFVTHHSGFVEDDFTQEVDRQLVKLLGVNGNPYCTMDRSQLPTCKSVLLGTGEMGYWTKSYTQLFDYSSNLPAYASVNIEPNADNSSVTVSGRVALGNMTSDDKVRISAYLVENHIPASLDRYAQAGVHFDPIPDAPSDLAKNYTHNGVIRQVLNKVPLGDAFTFDSEGNYSVTYPVAPLAAECVAANCKIVAFVHRVNAEDVTDCFVLNTGISAPLGSEAGICAPTVAAPSELQLSVIDGRIAVSTPVRSLRLFTAAGREVNPSLRQPRGIYIVRAVLPDGTTATAKAAL